VQLYQERNQDGTTKRTVKEICALLGIAKSTFYSYLDETAS
jgi:predicted DNA-binding transcriptional regulator AlpA